MELSVIQKLEKDSKIHEYLENHSEWYRLLNRNALNYNDFEKEYKNFKRERNYDKVNEVVDNIELMSNIVKMVE